MYDLRQLRHFIALAEHGHFARAAESVHLSQPAFSRSIQALESSLGCTLVDRHPRGITLTAQGALILEHARRVIANTRAMQSALSQLANLDGGELRVGAGPFPAARLVPLSLAQFSAKHPRVHCHLTVNHWPVLQNALVRGDIEMFIADARELNENDQLHIMPLVSHEIVMFTRPGHPLLSLQPFFPLAALNYPIAATHFPAEIEALLKKATSRDQLLSVCSDNFMVLKSIVLNSDAVSLAPWDVIASDVSEGRLARLPRGNLLPAVQSRYGIVTLAGNTLSPAAEALCRLVLANDKNVPPA